MKNFLLKKSFTLIETIVVIIIIGLVMPAIFAIIFGIVREQTKITRLSQVKREGDYILNTVSTLIKNNAISIHYPNAPTDANEKCKIVEEYPLIGTTIDRLVFKDKSQYWFRILWSANKIASYSSGTTSSIDLNSSGVLINNFLISCSRDSTYSPATVTLEFDICYKTSLGTCSGSNPEESATLHYQTKVKLRNF